MLSEKHDTDKIESSGHRSALPLATMFVVVDNLPLLAMLLDPSSQLSPAGGSAGGAGVGPFKLPPGATSKLARAPWHPFGADTTGGVAETFSWTLFVILLNMRRKTKTKQGNKFGSQTGSHARLCSVGTRVLTDNQLTANS